jgi:hypothetical protein
MRQTTMPDDSGWYWIQTNGLTDQAWAMAYLDIQGDEVDLLIHHLQRRSYFVGDDGDPPALTSETSFFRFNHDLNAFQDAAGRGSFMPAQWAGPMLDPNDEWATMQCQFGSEIHEEASQEKHAMVGIVVDRTYCSRYAGHASSYATMPAEQTEGLIGKFWWALDDQIEAANS